MSVFSYVSSEKPNHSHCSGSPLHIVSLCHCCRCWRHFHFTQSRCLSSVYNLVSPLSTHFHPYFYPFISCFCTLFPLLRRHSSHQQSFCRSWFSVCYRCVLKVWIAAVSSALSASCHSEDIHIRKDSRQDMKEIRMMGFDLSKNKIKNNLVVQ